MIYKTLFHPITNTQEPGSPRGSHSAGVCWNERRLGIHPKGFLDVVIFHELYPPKLDGLLWYKKKCFPCISASLPTQAFHLNCGFNCSKKCHLCDGCDWHHMSQGASWRHTCGNQRHGSPFWLRPDQIPLLTIPGMNKDSILPDSLHCFHLGWGQDLGASGVVLLAKLGHFNGRYLNDQLADAYGHFSGWVVRNHKTTGIDWWSKLKLDMASMLCFC